MFTGTLSQTRAHTYKHIDDDNVDAKMMMKVTMVRIIILMK